MLKNGFFIDGIKWAIGQHPPKAIPLCPKDFIVLDPYPPIYHGEFRDTDFKCEECQKIYHIPRTCIKELEFVLRKLNSSVYKKMKFINLDDEAIPIAESKIPKNSKYFVTSVLTKSKVGLRLVVYAGKNGKAEKTQIFVEPEIRRLAFDQTNLHPTNVFTKVEATFADGTKTSIEKKK
ncbi:MAG: hypothetical protein ACHQUA_00315 [Microgenomates group bacterium]